MKPSPALRPIRGAKEVPWATSFGKYNRIPVNRITNKRASDTIHDRSLPENPVTPITFMRSFVKEGYTALSTGTHGDIYTLKGPKTALTLKNVYGILQNKVTNIRPDEIPKNMTVVIKVVGIPKDEIEVAWSTPSSLFTGDVVHSYMNDLTEKTLRMYPKKFNIDPNRVIPDNLKRQKYREFSNNFASKPTNFRRKYLSRYVTEAKSTSWNDVLREGSTDAANHLHIRKAAPVPIHTTTGTITLDPKNVVPEFYFSGSDSKHGVYVIVMGVAHGKTMQHVKNSPELIANVEKALLTLASIGVEHGDLHPGNIMVGLGNGVTLIDFGMTAILPEKYALRATKAITSAVNTLLEKKAWPEKNSNALWYGSDNGIMRYMNSYMVDKHGKNFAWYNPSGKMLLHLKSFANKKSLDHARYQVWSRAVKRIVSRNHTPTQLHKRRILNYSNL